MSRAQSNFFLSSLLLFFHSVKVIHSSGKIYERPNDKQYFIEWMFRLYTDIACRSGNFSCSMSRHTDSTRVSLVSSNRFISLPTRFKHNVATIYSAHIWPKKKIIWIDFYRRLNVSFIFYSNHKCLIFFPKNNFKTLCAIYFIFFCVIFVRGGFDSTYARKYLCYLKNRSDPVLCIELKNMQQKWPCCIFLLSHIPFWKFHVLVSAGLLNLLNWNMCNRRWHRHFHLLQMFSATEGAEVKATKLNRRRLKMLLCFTQRYVSIFFFVLVRQWVCPLSCIRCPNSTQIQDIEWLLKQIS